MTSRFAIDDLILYKGSQEGIVNAVENTMGYNEYIITLFETGNTFKTNRLNLEPLSYTVCSLSQEMDVPMGEDMLENIEIKEESKDEITVPENHADE